MFDITQTLLHGAIMSLIASVYLLAVLAFNPRLFLQDYPAPIQDQVPPKTEEERRQSVWVGLPFLLILIAGALLSTLALQRASEEAVPFLFPNWHPKSGPIRRLPGRQRRRGRHPHPRYYTQADPHQQFAIYTELAAQTLAPVGDALGVVLEGDDWTPGDLARAADFWQTLFT